MCLGRGVVVGGGEVEVARRRAYGGLDAGDGAFEVEV